MDRPWESMMTMQQSDNSQSVTGYLGSLNMAEETMAHAPILTRPLNEAWNVGNDESGVVLKLHHSCAGTQRCKRVARDLSVCCRRGTLVGREGLRTTFWLQDVAMSPNHIQEMMYKWIGV